MKNLGLVQQLLGDLFARGPEPGSVRAGWTLHDKAIKEEFGQFLFGERSRHLAAPTLKRCAHDRMSERTGCPVDGIILHTHTLGDDFLD